MAKGAGTANNIWDAVHKTFPSITWFLPFLGPLVAILLLLLSGPRLFHFLVKFVSSRLPPISFSNDGAPGIPTHPL